MTLGWGVTPLGLTSLPGGHSVSGGIRVGKLSETGAAANEVVATVAADAYGVSPHSSVAYAATIVAAEIAAFEVVHGNKAGALPSAT